MNLADQTLAFAQTNLKLLAGLLQSLLSLDLPRNVMLIAHEVSQNAGFVEDRADVKLVLPVKGQ